MPYLANRRPSRPQPHPTHSHRSAILSIISLLIFAAVIAFCFFWISGPPTA